MAGNAVTQNFKCVMTTSLPASILGNKTTTALNYFGATPWNDAVGAALNVERFLNGSNVASESVSQAQWSDNGTDCVLNFTLTTVSDPATTSAIGSALSDVWDLILIGIGAALTTIGAGLVGLLFDLIGVVVALSGALKLLGISVTELGNAVLNNPILLGGAIIILALGAVTVYSIVKSPAQRERLAAGAVNVAAYARNRAAAYA